MIFLDLIFTSISFFVNKSWFFSMNVIENTTKIGLCFNFLGMCLLQSWRWLTYTYKSPSYGAGFFFYTIVKTKALSLHGESFLLNVPTFNNYHPYCNNNRCSWIIREIEMVCRIKSGLIRFIVHGIDQFWCHSNIQYGFN